ncbi:ABC transporter permease [Enterococcus canis]|nr:ABC transporter permease [Enterococcus canis]
MNKFWIIASDVYKKNVKSWSFLFMILVPFILMGIAYAAIYFAGGLSEGTQVGVVGDAALTAQFEAQKGEELHFKAYPDEKAAQKALEDEKVDGYLVVANQQDQISGKLYAESGLGNTNEMTIQQLLNTMQAGLNAGKLGLTNEEVATLSQPAQFEKTKISFNEDGQAETGADHTGIQYAVAYALVIVMFMIIITYASIIAQEIASEKGTRIMEVILSSTTAQTHFYGKLVGVLLVCLTQIAIYGIAGVVAFMQFKNLDIVKELLQTIDLQQVLGSYLIYILLYFIIGVFLYSVLAALCGSLVNKAEDTAKAVQPITYLALIGYIIGLVLGANDPQNIVVRITSYIPFLSSYIMPVRLAFDTAPTSSVVISLVLLLVTAVVLTIFSANMYKSNVLVYSEGGFWSSLKQSVSIMRNERKK